MVPLSLARITPLLTPLAVSSPRTALLVASAANITFEATEEHLIWSPSFAPQFAVAATTCAAAAFLVLQSPIARSGAAGWYPLYDSLFVRTGLWTVAGLLSSSCCLLQIMLNALSIGCAGFVRDW
jgi:hypothetical protein